MEEDTCSTNKSNKCCEKGCLVELLPFQKKILNEFNNAGSYEEKAKYLGGCMSNNAVHSRRANTLNMRRRDKTTTYIVNGSKICRAAFAKIFGISQKRVTVLRGKIETECYRKMSGRPRKVRKNTAALVDMSNESDGVKIETEVGVDNEEPVVDDNLKKIEPNHRYGCDSVESRMSVADFEKTDNDVTEVGFSEVRKKKKKKRKNREPSDTEVIENVVEELKPGDDLVIVSDSNLDESNWKKKKKKRKDREILEELFPCEEAHLMPEKKKKKRKDREIMEELFPCEEAHLMPEKKKKKRKDREILEELFPCEEAHLMPEKKKKKRKDREIMEELVLCEEVNLMPKKKKKCQDGSTDKTEVLDSLMSTGENPVDNCGKKKKKKKKKDSEGEMLTEVAKEAETANSKKKKKNELKSVQEIKLEKEEYRVNVFGEVIKIKKNRDEIKTKPVFDQNLSFKTEDAVLDTGDFGKKKKKKNKRKDFEDTETMEAVETNINAEEQTENHSTGLRDDLENDTLVIKKKKKKRRKDFEDTETMEAVETNIKADEQTENHSIGLRDNLENDTLVMKKKKKKKKSMDEIVLHK